MKILNFGSGHAWGMIGLQVELSELGSIILASDAIYTAESIGPPLKRPVLYMIQLVGQNLLNESNAWRKKPMQKFGLDMIVNNLTHSENPRKDIMSNDGKGVRM